mmetsp:Transcript_72469/g.158134  ORF Transcript_72469/g.158134 Transcript_72469/m.158134 type:complete len:202 (+) Transcript_72469:508-1113(+)
MSTTESPLPPPPAASPPTPTSLVIDGSLVLLLLVVEDVGCNSSSASRVDTMASSRSLWILLPRFPISQAHSSRETSNRTGTRLFLLEGPAESRRTPAAPPGTLTTSRRSKCRGWRMPMAANSTKTSWILATASSTPSSRPLHRTLFCAANPATRPGESWMSHPASSRRSLILSPLEPTRWRQATSGIMTSTVLLFDSSSRS